MTKVTMKQMMSYSDALKIGRALQEVVIQQSICTPRGTAIITPAAVARFPRSCGKPVANM